MSATSDRTRSRSGRRRGRRDYEGSNRRRDEKRERIKDASAERRAASKAETAERKKVNLRNRQRKKRQRQSLATFGKFEMAPDPVQFAPLVVDTLLRDSLPGTQSIEGLQRQVQGCPSPGCARRAHRTDINTSQGTGSPRNGSQSVIRWKDAGDQAQLLSGLPRDRCVGWSGPCLRVPPLAQYRVPAPRISQSRLATPPDRRCVGADVPLVYTLGYGRSGVLHAHGAIVLGIH